MRTEFEINMMMKKLTDYKNCLSWWDDEKPIIEAMIDGMAWTIEVLCDDHILPEDCKKYFGSGNNEK